MSTTETNIDEFDAAFDEATFEDTPGATREVADIAEGEVEMDAPEDTATPEERPAETTETVDQEENPQSKWEEEYNKMQQRMRSWEGRIEAERARRLDVERKLQELMLAKETQEEEEIDSPLPEWNKFKEEYDDLAAPIEAYIQAQIRKNVGKVEKKLDYARKEVDTSFEQQALNSHFAKITNAHPDWEDILASPDFGAWRNGLSIVEQNGIDTIMDKGTTNQIIDMFSYYKQSTGKLNNNLPLDAQVRGVKEGTTPSGNVVSPSNVDEDALVKKVLAALAVKSGKSLTPDVDATDVSEDDFDKAFELATRGEK